MTNGTLEQEVKHSLSSHQLSQAQFKRLAVYIEGELGIRMPPAKKIMLESRLQKRVRALRFPDFDAYLEYVFERETGGDEMLHMIDAVTTNKTDFFREPDHFVHLSKSILPELYERQGAGRRDPLLVWSSASSSGEEPYTLAMVLEEFRRENPEFSYRVLGTDISTAMLERGRRAIYTEERVVPVAPELQRRYLMRSKDRGARLVRVKPAVRANVVFQRLNLMSDRFNISDLFQVIFCRNVIIYFDRERQQRLLRKLYSYLVPGGFLFLGHSETLAGMELGLESYAPTVYRKPEV